MESREQSSNGGSAAIPSSEQQPALPGKQDQEGRNPGNGCVPVPANAAGDQRPAQGEEDQNPGNGSVPANAAGEQQPAQGQESQNPGGADEAQLLLKLRKYLVLLAILAAAITYQAGLAPPGGYWQDSKDGRLASDIVLRVSYPNRYHVFFYCNTTAFGASLIVLILLLVRELGHDAVWLRSLQTAMLLGLLGLMGAFAAGSCREVRTSVYIWALLIGIFAYVTVHVVFFRHLAPQCVRAGFVSIGKFWKCVLAKIFKKPNSTEDGQPAPDQDEIKDQERNRSFLLILATLAATVTYVAGLSPPGGFWPDEKNGHLAGDPVLRDHYPRRFKAFLVCNATAFAGSLVIVIMILSDTALDHVVKSNALRFCVLVSLFGLMGAYAAGSCREVSTSIYVFALVSAIMLYLVLQWIVPIVPKPDCLQRAIRWTTNKKKAVIKKLSSFFAKQDKNSSTDRSGLQSLSNTSSSDNDDDLQKLRTYLLLLGILAATVTYQAGLNPPGGFWSDTIDGHHLAGNPILETIKPKRYKAFFYCNSISFVASLVIITLLQSQLITFGAMKRYIMQTAMVLDLFGLMGAYAAGSSRKFSTSVYVFSLIILVFTYVVFHVVLSSVFLKTRLGFRRTATRNNDGDAEQDSEKKDEEEHWKKQRKFLMLLAILAASITYQAGLSPPGGFWGDTKDGHRAGDPVFHDEFPRRYWVFFYFNATAFMASLAVILLLFSKTLSQTGLRSYALRGCVLIDLFSLMVAFAAGNCRKVTTSVYVILVVAAVFVFVMIQVLVLTFAKGQVIGRLERMLKTRLHYQFKHLSMKHKRSKEREHKWRKDLMLIGTLAVTVTYQAGLLPPGGVWSADQAGGSFAGDPILHDINLTRYKVFFYCNATAFMASIVMVILLLNNTISKYERSLLAMKTAMVLDLLGLLGAYAAGSCRTFRTSACIFALVIAVCIYIAIHILWSFDKVAALVKRKALEWMPCLKMMGLTENGAANIQPSAEQSGEVDSAV